MAILDQNEEEKEVEFDKMAIIVPTTLATIESLTFPLVQEVVLLADFRCKRCQDRVADIVSRLDGEAESMEISLKEKKVTITLSRRHPKVLKMLENELQSVTMYKSPANKCSIVRKMFHSSCG
uniref:heavy metal-associated isoprenylated plant protein 45-like isoform X2 n=1 Tax=Erigeron canadensis TaxID=72917 RepID=UPI001CB8F682|nr:heavy metal-associated isoprenylated plant protein 45-like isoform X2 [Erigeron canadensis]